MFTNSKIRWKSWICYNLKSIESNVPAIPLTLLKCKQKNEGVMVKQSHIQTTKVADSNSQLSDRIVSGKGTLYTELSIFHPKNVLIDVVCIFCIHNDKMICCINIYYFQALFNTQHCSTICFLGLSFLLMFSELFSVKFLQPICSIMNSGKGKKKTAV